MALVENSIKLGFGLMRLPRLEDGKEIDIEQSKKMVDAFIHAGGRYFDTAFIYEGSEDAARKILVERYPRDRYYLADKINAGEFCCKNEEEAKQEFLTSLERTGAGYFDFYLLHAVSTINLLRYDKFGLWDYVKDLKNEGKIKHIGISFHDQASLLEEVLTAHPEIEFVQLQINYADWEDKSIQSKKCYDVATKHGKPVVVMEPVKGGTLANPPEKVKKVLTDYNKDASPASWAIRFVASLPNVMVVLSGMSNEAQMNDNLSFMKDFKPFSNDEEEVINNACTVLNSFDTIKCTACHYCTPGCPVGMHIPEIFSVMNGYKIYGDFESSKDAYRWRPGKTRASACIACGQCEKACPQRLPIISLLKDVAATFE